ncbi:uncharacterized protein LOC134532356 [Bacillus rossius redtenbacheri]|uniref:uncharacterized protein LOC134532356 n=1 Tax=Bacillus rossius redtenbacheri TaxID=93214 RepID=UPI002FDCF0C3
MAVRLVALACLLAASSALASSCVDRGAKANFDIPAFIDTWYIQKVAEFPGFSGTKCDQLTFSELENDQLKMIASFYNITSGEDGSISVMVRKLNPESKEARFTCQHEGLFTYENTHLNVLDTDYSSLAVMTFCEENTEKYTALLITRERSPPVAVLAAGEALLPPGLDYTVHDQTGCA